MKRRFTAALAGLALSALLVAPASQASAADLVIYTSMKEALIGPMTKAFMAKHPDIKVDHQSAGAGKLMAKIAAERQSGSILADILWTSEVPDFYALKREGLLEPYVSPNAKDILNPLPDFDGSFTPIRLGTLGIVYNTRFMKKAPEKWSDLFEKKNSPFGIANPALSGTAFVSVFLLSEQFGWDFFKDLKKNKAKMGKGSGQVIDDTAKGDLLACLGVDYQTFSKIDKGAYLGMAYPPEMLVVPSPAAIFKNSPNLDAAKKFIDFMLTEECQKIVAENGTLPVHPGVKVPAKYNLPDQTEAMKRAIPIDYPKLITSKQATVDQFTEIFGKKK